MTIAMLLIAYIAVLAFLLRLFQVIRRNDRALREAKKDLSHDPTEGGGGSSERRKTKIKVM